MPPAFRPGSIGPQPRVDDEATQRALAAHGDALRRITPFSAGMYVPDLYVDPGLEIVIPTSQKHAPSTYIVTNAIGGPPGLLYRPAHTAALPGKLILVNAWGMPIWFDVWIS